MMRVGVVSLFPEMFDVLGSGGITARAIERGLVRVERWNPRDYARDRHRTVDDRPYGGGPGMVMRVEPVHEAIAAAHAAIGADARTIYLSPQGRRLDQAAVASFAASPGLILVCGRYEGIDERLLRTDIDEEWSLGDYVLSGGEFAALTVIDAVVRLLPGALGDADSAAQDSFAGGLLDCPHYTRPEVVGELRVPAVLLAGNHEQIRRWRLKQALGRTWLRRPDMLAAVRLDEEQQALLAEFQREHCARTAPDDEEHSYG